MGKTVTLARAMVVRKRLAGKLVRLESDIRAYNSVVVGNEREVDVGAALVERLKLVNRLATLKLTIFEASAPVRHVIIGLSEAKAEIAFMNSIDTSHGAVKNPYSVQSEQRDAAIRRAEVVSTVEELEVDIDELQSALDHHNATTNVTLPE